MNESLTGRVAIVVGATSGMGRATAVQLARAGAVVTAAGRREERLEELFTELEAEGLVIDTCPCDVMVEEDVTAVVEQVHEAHGRVDLLVSDAELRRRREAYKPEEIQHQTPWQEIYRAHVGQLATGGCLELATNYHCVSDCIPRHNH